MVSDGRPLGAPLPAGEMEVDLRSVFRSFLRALPFMLVFALLVGGAAYALLSRAEPQFSADTKLLIESGDSDLIRTADPTETATLLDQEGVASQVQLIRSRDLAQAVIDRLGLVERREFDPAQQGRSLIDDVFALAGIERGADPVPVAQRVLETFVENLNVFPVDRTRVITIEFSSSDPQLAADIANAVAEQYLTMLRSTKRDTTADATQWLEAEIASLGAKVKEAEGKVEAFRSSSDLFGAGNNATLAQQQLADLSAELSRVRGARAEAEAKAGQIRQALANNGSLDFTDVLNSALIQRLREQQVALKATIAESLATLLPAHPRIREMEAQLADLETQIRAEARKILAGLENEATVAAGREREAEQRLAQLKAAAARSNEAEVQLRALERDAAAQRDLLQTYLLRYREAISRQSGDFLPVNARIISRASAPVEPFFPKKMPMTAAAVVVALMLAAGFILVRELAGGRSLRPVAYVAPLPMVPDAVPVTGRLRWSDDGAVRRMMPHDRHRSALADQVERSLAAIVAQITAAHARRVLATMADDASADGRPLAAVALSRALARAGARVVLVELRQDGADGIAMGEAEDLPGFGDLYAGETSFAQVIFRDRNSPAHFIPAGREPLPADVGEGDRLATLLDALDHTYDHVVYDVDDRMLALLGAKADAVVLVTEVGPSDPRTVRAYEAIKAASAAEVMLLVADPVPPAAEAAEQAA